MVDVVQNPRPSILRLFGNVCAWVFFTLLVIGAVYVNSFNWNFMNWSGPSPGMPDGRHGGAIVEGIIAATVYLFGFVGLLLTALMSRHWIGWTFGGLSLFCLVAFTGIWLYESTPEKVSTGDYAFRTQSSPAWHRWGRVVLMAAPAVMLGSIARANAQKRPAHLR